VAGEGVPTTVMGARELATGIPVTELLHQVGLCASRGAARRLIEQGGAYVNGERVASIDVLVTNKDLMESAILLRAGKKRYHRVILP